LIKTGSFDKFYDRQILLNNIELLLGFASKIQKQVDSKQLDLFGNLVDSKDQHIVSSKLALDLNSPTPINQRQYLAWERELLGIYLSQHPLNEYADYLATSCNPVSLVKEQAADTVVKLGGMITDMREITTKKGQKMAFLKMEDLSGEIEVVVFPKVYLQYSSLLTRDNIVRIAGKVSTRGNSQDVAKEKSIMADTFSIIEPSSLDEASLELAGPGAKGLTLEPQKVYIRLADTADGQMLIGLKKTIDEYIGSTKVVIVLGDKDSRQAIKLPGGFDHLNEEGLDKLANLVGHDNLKIS
jgi:DNA polymerase-3 subunit alpha